MIYVEYKVAPVNGTMLKYKFFATLGKTRFKVKVKVERANYIYIATHDIQELNENPTLE